MATVLAGDFNVDLRKNLQDAVYESMLTQLFPELQSTTPELRMLLILVHTRDVDNFALQYSRRFQQMVCLLWNRISG